MTERIKVGVEAVWELIRRAYLTRAWAVLGYRSWDDYCTREFGASRLRLPREERHEIVVSMREIGMSTRAIAAATGVSKNTITEDLRQVSQSGTPEPEAIAGIDGRTYPPSASKPPVTDLISANELAELNSAITAPAPTIVTPGPLGEKPLPRPRNRAPLPDSFSHKAFELTRAAESLKGKTDDDRFARNAEEIARKNLGDLIRARDAVQYVIDRLTNQQKGIS
ncbi:hypothetical protein AWN90_40210 [Nocardia terpenica]|uniref:Uncharacterized protein n=1 Tax=Nocardia terpenica TaxID=455432 RepID=A0A164JW94_9NOCA|nr:hypothetical protein AWN90_40210 [Nocardia terpenica]